MKKWMWALLGLLLFGTESVFAHGGTHPTPGPLPPSPPPPTTVPPTPVPTPTPTTPTPGTPGFIFVPANSSTGGFTVYWGAVGGITGYELEEDVQPTFPNQWRYSFGSTVTAVSITNRANGTWYYRVRAVNNGVSGAWCTGGNGCVVLLQGTLRLAIGSASPASVWAPPGSANAAVLQARLSVDLVESITLQSLTFHARGSIQDPIEIAAACLYLDANRNGALDKGTDVLLGGPLAFGADDGAVAFQSLARTLGAGSSEDWLFVVDLGAGAPAGATFQACVQAAGDVSAQGSLTGGPPIVLGPPLQGSQLTVSTSLSPPPPATVGSLTLGAGPGNPGNGTVCRGSEKNVLLHLCLTARPGEHVRLDTLALTFFGTMREPSGRVGFSLYEDSNQNHALDAGDRRIRGPVPIFPGDSNVLFLALGELIYAGTARVWFVTADVSRDVEIGNTLGVNLDNPQLVSAIGQASKSSVPLLGTPILGPEWTVVEGPAEPAPSASRAACGGGADGASSWPGALGPCLLLAVCLACLAARGTSAPGGRP